MVFNPIIETLQQEIHRGYDLKGEKLITLPYADDFCLITTNKRTHQKIMNVINARVKTMEMKLKPSKCRTFSIQSGVPNETKFFLEEVEIPTIFEEDQKFLFPTGKSSETFNHVKSTLETKLENIDKLVIRNEYKLWIYKHYLLPSTRFLLTVHDLPKSYLSKLDVFTDKYIKKWTGIPRCATNAALHLKHGLDIPSITHLYTLTTCVTYTRTRLQGDSKVNHALSCKLDRERTWSKQFSPTVQADNTLKEALNTNLLFEIPQNDNSILTLRSHRMTTQY